MPETIIDEIDTGAPRVEACINAVMKRYPGESKAALARYFEAVHQELGPLARDLERQNAALREPLTDAAIAACALMIKGICMTRPPEEWANKIEARIRFMLAHGKTEAARNGDES